jgi:hypothetical protein
VPKRPVDHGGSKENTARHAPCRQIVSLFLWTNSSLAVPCIISETKKSRKCWGRWLVVGCCHFRRLIMAWTSIVHARQFLVQTSHDPSQSHGRATVIVVTSAAGDQVNEHQMTSAVIAFRHGRFDSKRCWWSTLTVVDFYTDMSKQPS